MKKQLWIYVILGCILLLSVFIAGKIQFTPSQEEVQETEKEGKSEDSYKMSDYSVLDVQDLEDVTIEKDYLRPITEMLNDQPGYENMHDDLLSFLSTVSGYGYMGNDTERKFFVSKTPVYYWSPKKGQVGKAQVDVMVFSYDLKNVFCYSMLYENNEYISESMGEFNPYILKTLKDNKNKKFVFLYDVLTKTDTPVMLSEDNMIYGSAENGDYTVNGDYFSRIAEIAVSYEDMTAPGNLVEINIS